MYTTQKLCIELTSQDNENTHRVYTVQGDYCTRKLELTLYCGGEPWRLPEGATVAVRYQKPDGTQGIYDTLPDGTKAWDAQENTVTVMLAPQMLTVPGCVIAQVEMVLGSLVLSTFSIHVIVKDDPSDGVTESEDYVNWQQWMNDQLDQHLSQAAADGRFIPAFSIGTVSTLPPGASATADITGSVDRPILNLGIPASGTGCIADPTLSLSGYSADAKATGDALRQLEANTVPGTESTEHPGSYYRVVNGEVQWINPPMIFDTEHLTTERWNGAKIYTRQINMGTIPDNDFLTAKIGIPEGNIAGLRILCSAPGVNYVSEMPVYNTSTGAINIIGFCYNGDVCVRSFIPLGGSYHAYAIIHYLK